MNVMRRPRPMLARSKAAILLDLQKELRRQTRFWRASQNKKGEWCAFHNGVMWGLHIAIKRIKGERP